MEVEGEGDEAGAAPLSAPIDAELGTAARLLVDPDTGLPVSSFERALKAVRRLGGYRVDY